MIKRIAIFVFFSFIIPIVLFAQAEWSSPITFGQGDTPDFSIDENTGYLHIVYHKKSSGVMYVVTDSQGNILSGPEVVPHTDGDGNETLADDDGEWEFGASIDVDQQGYPNICYRIPREDNYFDLKYIRKTSSGWSTPLLLSSNVRRGYVVRMAIDGDNRVHIGQSKVGDTIWGEVKYFRVYNGIKEKETTLTLTDGSEYRADNRFEVGTSQNGGVHFLIGCPGLQVDNTIGPVTYYRSTDSGNTFKRVTDIHNRSDCTSRNGMPDVFIDASDHVHFVYGARIDNSTDGDPSLRYVRYDNGKMTIDKAITVADELSHWEHKDYGLGSIASTTDGEYVYAAYLNTLAGSLYIRHSTDGGNTWSSREKVAENIGSADGRSLHLLRANKNNFYLIYPENGSKQYVRMRMLLNIGDEPPVADAGGPYTQKEGSPVTLDASGTEDSGQNPGIVLYEWDLDSDGVYDLSTTEPTIETLFDDDYSSTLVLKVTDNVGYTDTSHTHITITNVAPTVSIGKNLTINEGDTIHVSGTVTDPGNDVISYAWTMGDGTTYTESSISHQFADNGKYNVTLVVNDGDGGTAQAKIQVTVNNVKPTAVIQGNYQASINIPVVFTGIGTDPGPADEENLIYAWDLNNDGIFEESGSTVSRSFEKTGTYTIWFKVSDDDGAKDSTSTLVVITNAAPSIQPIPNQEIREGESFSDIHLDNYVEDNDQTAEQLTWSYKGGNALSFTLENHILSIATPSLDWFGQDSLWLFVVDPGDLKDSVKVHFIVTPVNDGPQWKSVPDFQFNEDDTLHLSFSTLNALVEDIDNGPEDFRYSFSNMTQLTWQVDSTRQRFDFIPTLNWSGTQEVIFTVWDKDNAVDRDTSLFTIKPVYDSPNSFSIIDPLYLLYDFWPDSIVFIWEEATDPDSGDQISYEWTLKRQGSLEVIARNQKTMALELTFHCDSELEDGTYFWWITAIDQTGMTKRSSKEGIIIVGDPTQADVEKAQIPKEFNLLPCFPNPFNPRTTVTYQLPEPAHVRIEIYNLKGQRLITLAQTKQPAGVYSLQWDGTDFRGTQVPSGIYLIQLIAGNHRFLQKISLIR